MPFNIDLISSDHQSTVILTIDRDNLIIRYTSVSSDLMAALEQESKFSEAFHSYVRPLLHHRRGHLDMSLDRDETLHLLEGHLCETDKNSSHMHIKLNKLIDLETTNILLNAIPRDKWLSLITEESYKTLFEAIEEYFCDPNYAARETEYQLERQKQISDRQNYLKDSRHLELTSGFTSYSLSAQALAPQPLDTNKLPKIIASVKKKKKAISLDEHKDEKVRTSVGFYENFARNLKNQKGKNALSMALAVPASETINRTPHMQGFYALLVTLNTEEKAIPVIQTIKPQPNRLFFFNETNASRYAEDRAKATQLTQEAMNRALKNG